MTASFKPAALLAASLLLGVSFGGADAMPMASSAMLQTGAAVEPAAYLHRRYPGDHSRAARQFRHARRNSPNRYCQNQPSRCR